MFSNELLLFENYLNYGLITLAVIIATYFIYWTYQPYNYLKDLTDIGYSHIYGVTSKKISRAIEINRLRKMRDAGDGVPPPFPNGWYMVTLSENLKQGKSIAAALLGQNVVAFRTANGEAHVFDAYCPHLGANLGIGGKVKNDCIECPFHEWKFRASDGECVEIPFEGKIPTGTKLKKWISCEVNGAVFIWYNVEGDEPWEFPLVEAVDDGSMAYYGKSEFIINGHIQQIPENASDASHLTAIHSPNLFTGSDPMVSKELLTAIAAHTWDLTYEPSTKENEKHCAYMKLKHSFKLFKMLEMFELHVEAKQVGPSYVILWVRSYFGLCIILQTVVPTEPLMQRVLHRFYLPPGQALFSKFLIYGESIMFERDMAVWNHQRFLHNPILLKEEKSIKAFRKWYGQFYTEKSHTYADLKKTLDW